MNNYTIIGYDEINKEFLVDYDYNNHQLRDRISVEDPTNADLVKTATQAGYDLFVTNMDEKDASTIVIPTEVQDLIGMVQEQ